MKGWKSKLKKYISVLLISLFLAGSIGSVSADITKNTNTGSSAGTTPTVQLNVDEDDPYN
ncbi:MAG: hypothetical protein FH761_10455 [Firmicutes bacterium]|nr:hypothetical protein [Bacillota bacterium]